MDTTPGIVSSAMSAKDGRTTEVVRARAGASRWASDRGVMLTEPATIIPKTTAAAIRTEKDNARLVDFCIGFFSPPTPALSAPEFNRATLPDPASFLHGGCLQQSQRGTLRSPQFPSRSRSTAMHRSIATGIP